MNSVPFRAVLLFLVALVAVGSMFSIQPTQEDSARVKVTDGPCIKTGVTLIVDFGTTNKELISKCVEEFNGSGWSLLQTAGIKVEGTAEYPNAFVCRLDAVPSVSDQDCRTTPSMLDGSWVYYMATAANDSNDWVRSGEGAASRNPECGDFEGWKFVTPTNEEGKDTGFAPSFDAKPFVCN
jgi:hypothetical protein